MWLGANQLWKTGTGAARKPRQARARRGGLLVETACIFFLRKGLVVARPASCFLTVCPQIRRGTKLAALCETAVSRSVLPHQLTVEKVVPAKLVALFV